MSKKLKKWMAEEVRSSVGVAESCVVVGYKSLGGETSTTLRAHLRKSQVELTVLRNRVAVNALADSALKEIRPLIKGQTAVATGGEDPVALAKAVVEGVKGQPGFEFRGGFVEGRIVSGEEVQQLAALPSKPDLLGMIASAVAAPMTNIAYGVDAILTGLARAVEAVRVKVEKEGNSEPAAS
jgi:large subunit ribosomal protein L10